MIYTVIGAALYHGEGTPCSKVPETILTWV